MVGWHHQLNGHEFEQTLGDGDGQGSLACCSPWGLTESDTAVYMFSRYSVNSSHFLLPPFPCPEVLSLCVCMSIAAPQKASSVPAF